MPQTITPQEEYKQKLDAIMKEMAELGHPMKIVPKTGGERSADEQRKAYDSGASQLSGEVGKESSHQLGLGNDLMFDEDTNATFDKKVLPYKIFGEVAKKHGLTWGGDFGALGDFGHIEHPSFTKLANDRKAEKQKNNNDFTFSMENEIPQNYPKADIPGISNSIPRASIGPFDNPHSPTQSIDLSRGQTSGPSVEEPIKETLAQLVKANYPEYNEVEDIELEKLVRAKYPGEYDHVPSSVIKTAVVPPPNTVEEFNKTHPAPITGRGIGTERPIGEGPESILDPLTRPLTELPSRFAHSISSSDFMSGEDPRAKFGRGVVDFLGDAASNLTSPAGLATLGGSALEKTGLSTLGNLAMKAGSVPFMSHGSEQLVNPSSTSLERVMGGVELVGGGMEMREPNPMEDLTNRVRRNTQPIPPDTGPFDLQSHISGPGLQGEVSPSTNITRPQGMAPGIMSADRLPNSWESIRNKLRQQMPEVDKVPPPVNKDVPITTNPKGLREWWNVTKGLQSVDLPFITSAGLRQARTLIGTKNWWKAWVPSVKAYGSQAVADAHLAELESRPLLSDKIYGEINPTTKEIDNPRSLFDITGVKLSDGRSFSGREESIRSSLAERIPVFGKVIKASNRSYGAYINDIRVNTTQDLINDAIRNYETALITGKDTSGVTQGMFSKYLNPQQIEALDPRKNFTLAKKIGDFVNDSTGRGKLEAGFGKYKVNLEKSAKGLNDVLYAPRLITSRMKFFNPDTYINQSPLIRKQYLKGLMGLGGSWLTFSGLAKMGGADVSADPTSADFGKIKIGDTRLDPGAGFQQILVELARLSSGESTSSTTGKTNEFGQKFGGPTAWSSMEQYGASKLHPFVNLAYSILSSSKGQPVNLMDRSVQTAVPLIIQDLTDLIREDPKMLMLSPLISAGMGSQRYGNDSSKNKFIPEDFDLSMQGFPFNISRGGS